MRLICWYVLWQKMARKMSAYSAYDNTLALQSYPILAPQSNEVRIQVKAAGINRADIFQVQGRYPSPEGAPAGPGLEVSGVIESCGPNVSGINVGDTVCALLEGGGYATHVVVPCTQILPIPEGLSFEEAAVLPEACFTVWYNLFHLLTLRPQSSVLIHGGSSGIATMAIQVLKCFGHTSIVTTSRAEKVNALKELGANHVLNYHEEDFVEAVSHITGGKGVDVVFDMVGGPYFQRNMKALAVGGVLLSIAFLQGAKTEVNFASLLMKNLTIKGSTLRNQSHAIKAKLTNEIDKQLWPFVAQGKIRPLIDQQFAFSDVKAAHEVMMGNYHVGKLVLSL